MATQAGAAAPAAAAGLTQAASPAPLNRPRVGLVLSGGGARGLAHVGVLKVLERERIPVDVITGTSMGSIIGGLHAGGMSASQMEEALLKVDWDTLFDRRVERPELSYRRKQQDYDLSAAVEVGMRDGELKLPLGTVSSRGLELLLRRYTLQTRRVKTFDDLPIRFRAVATDMETGAPVIFDRGDLAVALRSSMSVPGVFPPVEVEGRILGDGGLVNNVPTDVARAMGADVLIVVNIGTPLAPRSSLDTLIGVTSQMISILTEQNVARSLATLDRDKDILVAPDLGALGAGDFKKAGELIALGERKAEDMAPVLRRLSLTPEQWGAHLRQRPALGTPELKVARVEFEGSRETRPDKLSPQLSTQVGRTFNVDAAERDTSLLASTDDYERTDYHLKDLPDGQTGVVFKVDEKHWGPHFFRSGLSLNTDLAGTTEFNLKLAHTRRWMNQSGAEWRNALQLGSRPRLYSELAQPLSWHDDPRQDWNAAPFLRFDRQDLVAYASPGYTARTRELSEVARYARASTRAGVDLVKPLAKWGEMRLGAFHEISNLTPTLLSPLLPDLSPQRVSEQAMRIQLAIDQVDFATFPTSGYRLDASFVNGRRWGNDRVVKDGVEPVSRFEFDGSYLTTVGEHTVNWGLRYQAADQKIAQDVGYFSLGGFQNLSGYKTRQFTGNYVALGKAVYQYRLSEAPVLTRGFFWGGSIEAGNAWELSQEMSLSNLRTGSSLYLGADTGIGPLYVGVGYAPRGPGLGVFIQLGRP